MKLRCGVGTQINLDKMKLFIKIGWAIMTGSSVAKYHQLQQIYSSRSTTYVLRAGGWGISVDIKILRPEAKVAIILLGRQDHAVTNLYCNFISIGISTPP